MVKISSSTFEEEIKKIISELEDLREVAERIEAFSSRLKKTIERAIEEAARSKNRLTFEIPITDELYAEFKTSPAVFGIFLKGNWQKAPLVWQCLPNSEWSFRTFCVMKLFIENFEIFFRNLVEFRSQCEEANKEAKQVLNKLEELFAPLLIASSMKS